MNQLALFEPLARGVPKYPSEPIIRHARIEGKYRRWLRRAWGSGPAICWGGLNPSLADGDKDDPTMREEMGFSFRWGFGSLIKVSLYPFISPSPAAMRKWRNDWLDRDAKEAFIRNAHDVVEAIRSTDVHVAAWGNGADPEDLEWFQGLLREELAAPPPGDLPRALEWQCLGTTQSGAPTHTLARGTHRIPRDRRLAPWGKAA